MRERADGNRIRAFADALGRSARSPARLYLVGGATAVVHGWRASTVDIDICLEPDSDDLLRAIARLKDELDVNVELASPPDFIPELPRWRDRSPWIFRAGPLDVHHFDLYSQALAKLERGFEHDLADVRAMAARGLIDGSQAIAFLDVIDDQLFRYPQIDAAGFRSRVLDVLG